MSKKAMVDLREKPHLLAKGFADDTDCDVVIYAGSMYPGDDYSLNQLVRSNPHPKTNVLVLLTTFGGLADCAYRIARCFQEIYRDGEFRVFVDTFCKSAGTLMALGADEIIMSEDAEFGPLDVQLRKPDEIEERMSGLTATQALSTLRLEVYGTFEDFFVTLRRKTGITSKIAADVAAQLTVGIFSPIYSQMEPMRLGENQRAMLVASDYGKRLLNVSKNANNDALDHLIGEYPAHEFVIDRTEAGTIFKSLRSPLDIEAKIAASIREICLGRLFDEENKSPLIDILNVPRDQSETHDDNATPQQEPGSGDLPQGPSEADGKDSEAKKVNRPSRRPSPNAKRKKARPTSH